MLSMRLAPVLSGFPILAIFIVWGAACSSPQEGGDLAVGVPTRVVVLEEGFVRFEGQRMAQESFFLEIRTRVRAVDPRPELLPWVIVLAEAPLPPGFTVELRNAGVQHIRLGDG